MRQRAVIALVYCYSFCFCASAQVGISTTSPNSSLHAQGSVATKIRLFTTSSTATAGDNILVFTWSAAACVRLPSAVGLKRAGYLIKNAGPASPASVLSINPATAETIDGLLSHAPDQTGEAITIVKNGNPWLIGSQDLPSLAAGINWDQNGNKMSSLKSVGTTGIIDLPFIRNNTEKMRLSAGGSLGIGTPLFDAVNSERPLVNAGPTTSYNVVEPIIIKCEK